MATLLIKKYGNRRLYDTVDSCYITQEELAERIRAGADVRVIDAKSGVDLTQATLVQMILEGTAARLLPVPLLTQLLRMGDDAMGEFFSRYVSAALEMYVQTRLRLGGRDALMPFWMNPFASMAAAPTGHPTTPSANVSDSNAVAALRRELAELKRSMKKPRKPARSR